MAIPEILLWSEVPILIERQSFLRRWRLARTSQGIVARVAMTSSKASILNFFEQHHAWIEHQYRMCLEIRQRISMLWPMPQPGGHWHFFGQTVPLRVHKKQRACWDDEGIAYHPDRHHHPLLLWKALEREARSRLLTLIEPWVKEDASKLQVPVLPIHVRNMRTQWGSCSVQRLQFAQGLVAIPAPLIRSVVTHEVVHQRHPHHGRAFWDEVYALDPAYRVHAKALNEQAYVLDLKAYFEEIWRAREDSNL